MKVETNFVLNRIGKKPILIDCFFNKNIESQRVIIFCHGYKGFKDWGAWNLMAKAVANAGFCFVKFNFSHNGGTVNQPIDFPDLEAFGQNNYTRELDDLGDVISWSVDYFGKNKRIHTNKICLIGHSRGGGIATLKASQDPRITKLISLAGVSDFESRFGDEKGIKKWQEDGVKFIQNGRTKQQMPHYFQFYEDFMANKEILNIESACKKINIPQLIIHGSEDTSVKLFEAENLHKWNPKSEMEIIPNANHVFNTKHPWEKGKLTRELQQVVDLCIEFLGK